MKTLRVIGGLLTDTIYSMDFGWGEINWNVSKIEAVIRPGKRIEPALNGIRLKRWKPPMPERAENWQENCDIDKIQRFKSRPDILKIPLIGIGCMGPDGLEYRCFCDGNHRLMAMLDLGYESFLFHYVSPEIEKGFRVHFVMEE